MKKKLSRSAPQAKLQAPIVKVKDPNQKKKIVDAQPADKPIFLQPVYRARKHEFF